MAGFFGSIESSFNSLLGPLTSGLDPETTTVAKTSTSATSATSASRTPTTASESRTSIPKTSSTSSQPTSTTTRPSSSSSTDSTSSTTDASTSSQTTFSTSTTTNSSQSSSTSSLTSTTSAATIPAAPAASPTQSPVAPVTQKDTGGGDGISTAGIAVAAVFGVLLAVSIVYLLLRFCSPIRKRVDAFYQRRRDERSYREALDGPTIPKKDDSYNFDSTGRLRADSEPGSIEYEKSRISMAAAKQLNLPQRPLSSFFALGRNPTIQTVSIARQPDDRKRNTRFSWEAASQQEIVHQQYASPNSAEPEDPRGQGLGLGRVSLLHNHSLLRKAGYDVPPKLPGPSMTTAQAEIATAGAVTMVSGKKNALSPVRTIEVVRPVQQQEIRRKPVGGAPHIVSMIKNQHHTQQNGKRERSRSPPRLNIDVPLTPVSQIGVAVSGTPRAMQAAHFR